MSSATSVLKCLYCKGNAVISNGVQCKNCDGLYHKRCAARCATDVIDVFNKCCGQNLSGASSYESVSSNNSPNNDMINDFDNLPANDLADATELAEVEAELDDKLKPLWKLMENRFFKLDGGLSNVCSTLNFTVKRVDKIDKRVRALEESARGTHENIYQEVKDRIMRERNFIIFNADDGPNASNNDLPSLKRILIDSGLKDPFSLEDIKVKRLGKEFKQDKCRPLKVILKAVEDVQWVFANKKKLHGGKLIIAADQTKTQQDICNKVKRNGVPAITSKNAQK